MQAQPDADCPSQQRKNHQFVETNKHSSAEGIPPLSHPELRYETSVCGGKNTCVASGSPCLFPRNELGISESR